MKAIYFPFTAVSDEMMTALHQCFDAVAIYQPSLNLSSLNVNSKLEIRCPVQGDEERLDSIIKEYQNWTKSHQGADLSLFRFIVDDEESSIIRIRQNLTDYDTPKSSEKTDVMFNARLFLKIAHEFDMQQQETEKEISAYEKMEKALMEELRGETDDDSEIPLNKIILKEDAGAYMTTERMNAWTRLMLQDKEESCLFITGSNAVIEYFSDKADLKQIEEIENVRIPKACLEHAAFYKIAENPRSLFARCAKISMNETPSGFDYTIIGIIRY